MTTQSPSLHHGTSRESLHTCGLTLGRGTCYCRINHFGWAGCKSKWADAIIGQSGPTLSCLPSQLSDGCGSRHQGTLVTVQ